MKRHVPTLPELAEKVLGLPLSPAQRTLLKGMDGLPLDAAELELWAACTGGRTYIVGHRFQEVVVVAGARGGKDSRIACPAAVYEALYGGHEKHLARGERAVIPLYAQDARATRVAFGFIREAVTNTVLSRMVEDILASEIKLRNRVDILCLPCTQRSGRGFSIPAGVMDELAFWRLEGAADADAEIQASIRRGMLAFPRPRLVKISTPYLKAGLLYADFVTSFGKPDPDRLVWRAPSSLMNPTLLPERLAQEQRLDPSRFAREYLAEFSEDLDAFLPAAWAEGAVVAGRHELGPQDGVVYWAAVDASGGGSDAFTLAIVHAEGDRIVQDVVRGWKGSRTESVDLESIVAEAARLLHSYGIGRVAADRYAGAWVRQSFGRHGIDYESPEGMDRSVAYLATQALFARGVLELLDHAEQTREFRSLEKRLRPGGKVVVDHPAGRHDDHSNALALAVAVLLRATTESPAIEFGEGVGAAVSGMTRASFGLAPLPFISDELPAAIGDDEDDEVFWGDRPGRFSTVIGGRGDTLPSGKRRNRFGY